MRLFVVAFGFANLSPDGGFDRNALEVAERFADGQATRAELADAHRSAGGYPGDFWTWLETCASLATEYNPLDM